VNDGGGSGASCGGIKVRRDTTKQSNIVIADFGDGRNLVGECKMFIKGAAKVASRVNNVLSEELCLNQLVNFNSNNATKLHHFNFTQYAAVLPHNVELALTVAL